MSTALSVTRLVACALVGFLVLVLTTPAHAQAPVATLTPDQPGDLDNFGFVLDYDQGLLLIGAPGRDSAGANAGIAYIFRRENGTWTQEATLQASDPAPGDEFGDAVALQGNIAFVGSNRRDNGRGGVYVFALDNGTWTQRTLLTQSDDEPSDVFSYAFEVEGNRMLISSYGDSEGAEFAGAAYIFERDASGQWSEVAKLIPSDPVASGWFAAFVALDGDRALLGATGYDEEAGVAYIFERGAGDQWNEVTKLAASDGVAGDRFGAQVALDGDYAYVAASRRDAGAEESGTVYIFKREGAQWSQLAQLNSPNATNGGRFGESITAQGDMLLIGASGEGNVYQYEHTDANTWEERTRFSTGVENSLLGRDLVLNGTEMYVGDRRFGGSQGGVFQFMLSDAPTAVEDVPLPRPGVVHVYPNPVTTSTHITVDLPQATEVSVAVFDLLGRRVLDHPVRRLGTGKHEVEVDLTGYPAGVYLYRVQTQARGFSEEHTGRMVLLR